MFAEAGKLESGGAWFREHLNTCNVKIDERNMSGGNLREGGEVVS